MAFNIHEVNQRNNLSLIEILFNRKRPRKKSSPKEVAPLKRDSLTISKEAQALVKTKKTSSVSSNTRIDQSIDVQSYFENAKKANQEAIASAGDEINFHNKKLYTSEIDVYTAALHEKYSRLLQEAKMHSNPQGYINEKYNNPNSKYYVSDLSEVERITAYSHEINMLNYGRLASSMEDSLFRGMTLSPQLSLSQTEFDRQMVNSQINNILKKNGIDLADGHEFSFRVAPYTYEISVDGVDFETKMKVEKALNVGSNGENLYKHIRASATHEGVQSVQITKDGTLKNRLYYDVSNMLGLDVRTLSEKNGTYYTNSGEDIIALFNRSADESKMIPDTHKAGVKEKFAELVRQISSRGWNNMADMFLSIGYNQSGLIDKYQDYGFGATSREWLENKLNSDIYSVI